MLVHHHATTIWWILLGITSPKASPASTTPFSAPFSLAITACPSHINTTASAAFSSIASSSVAFSSIASSSVASSANLIATLSGTSSAILGLLFLYHSLMASKIYIRGTFNLLIILIFFVSAFLSSMFFWISTVKYEKQTLHAY